ncbi:MAG: T9SS type A sorting domain-containing protein [bacterium]
MLRLSGLLRVGAGVLLAFLISGPVGAAGLFQAEDFQYLGAFRTPVSMQNILGSTTDALSYCKGTDAYYPDGDPQGPDDGFPGSLFGVGHAWTTPMFEISIPAPVNSKRVSDLPVATLLQAPANVANPIYIAGDGLKGIEYLPAQAGMSGAKLHITVGQHYQYDPRPTHGWMDLDLSNPHTVGAWYIGTESQVSCLNTNEYVVTIPKDWADENVGGMRLACGRYREGQVATGPTLVAYAPWLQGNPPPPNTHLSFLPLIHYRNLDPTHGLEGFCNADNWTGAAWLYNEDKASVAIVGTKGFGDCWYGWQDGMRPEICATWPGGCEANGYGGSNRGYYASSFRTVILLYDPHDLARVARAETSAWTPQPYLMFDITPYMIRPETTYEIGTGGVAYDDVRGYLYVTERGGDVATEKNIVHVFKIAPAAHGVNPGNGDPNPRDLHGSSSTLPPNGVAGLSVRVTVDRRVGIADIQMASPAIVEARHVMILDVQGRLVRDLGETTAERVAWPTRGIANGVYFARVESKSGAATGKIVVVQ